MKPTSVRPGCMVLVALTALVIVVCTVAFFGVILAKLSNAVDVHCYSVHADQDSVRPPIAEAELYDIAPLALGRLCMDATQSVVWWVIDDGVNDTVAVGDVRVHGPLSVTDEDTAPAVLLLGVAKNAADQFVGTKEAPRATIERIIRNSERYYIAFFAAATNAEVARNRLDSVLSDSEYSA